MPIPLPVIPNVFRVALEWDNLAGQTAVNVIHIKTQASGVTPAAVFTCLDAHVTANMWDTTSDNSGITTVKITPLDGSSASADFLTSRPARWAPAGSGQAVPNVAVLVKLQTPLRGRDNRGRIFLPFTGESSISNGIVDAATVVTMTTAWNTFADDIDADGTTPMDLGVASYDRRHAGAGAHFNAASAITVEGVAGTQRRRQSRLR